MLGRAAGLLHKRGTLFTIVSVRTHISSATMGRRRVLFQMEGILKESIDHQNGPSVLVEEKMMPLQGAPISEPKKKEKSFTQKLFTHPRCQEIVEGCKKTKFMSGMATGTLLADQYGGYMVQDAAYCYYAVPSYELAADKLQLHHPEFSLLYRRQAGSYQKYNQEFVNTWRLKSPDSVLLGDAAKTYVKYESAVSQANPKALCIAMLPCQMLWPKLANDMGGNIKEGNPYKPWFDDNKTSGGPSSLEKFIDYFFREEDVCCYFHLFLEGMTNELNFFLDACDQDLFYYTKDFKL